MSAVPWPGGSPADTALVAVLVVVDIAGVAAELAASPNPNPAALGGYALAVAAALPLLARRRAPIVALAAVVACVLAYHLIGYPGFAPALALFVAVYSAAAYGPDGWGWIAGIAGAVAALVVPILPKFAVPWYSYSVTAPAAGIATMVVIGVAARRRRLDTEERVRQATETAGAQLRQRLAEERLTVARELHDVLAHTISVIAVQSGVALDAIDTDVDAAKEAMRTVRVVARKAMPDLRAALVMLRATGNPELLATGVPELLAQPGLADLSDLVDSVRATGLRAELTVAADRPDVTPFVELAAYRVVQEALTNVVRHAQARSVTVTIAAADGELVVTIVDDGRGIGPADHCRRDDSPAGFGLLGMRERAALVAGTVHIGSGPDDQGTAVTVRLPLGFGRIT